MSLNLLNTFSQTHEQVTQKVQHYYNLFDHLIIGAIIFVVFFLLAWIVGRIFRRMARRNDAGLAITLGRLVRNLLLVIGVITALSSAGTSVSNLIASIGLWALAVGYGMQYIFANIGAGFMIMLSGEVRKGDHISIYGNTGIIINMNLRYTTLKNGDNLYVIPNNLFVTYPITKFANTEK
jgi:small conductance mechanosensitive channel